MGGKLEDRREPWHCCCPNNLNRLNRKTLPHSLYIEPGLVSFYHTSWQHWNTHDTVPTTWMFLTSTTSRALCYLGRKQSSEKGHSQNIVYKVPAAAALWISWELGFLGFLRIIKDSNEFSGTPTDPCWVSWDFPMGKIIWHLSVGISLGWKDTLLGFMRNCLGSIHPTSCHQLGWITTDEPPYHIPTSQWSWDS